VLYPNNLSEALPEIIASNYNLALKIIDSIQTGISITTDVSCKEIRHNKVAAKFLRIEPWDSYSYSAPEMPPVRLLHQGHELSPDEMPIELAAWHGQQVRDMEIEFVWDDGVHKYSVWTVSPLFSDYGLIVGAVATFEDVTAQRKLELELVETKETLSQSKERFLTLFQKSPTMLAIIREEDDQHVEVNQKWLEVLGYSREEVIGRSLAELNIITGVSVATWREANNRARNNEISLNYEAVFHTNSGDIIYTLISTVPIKFNGQACRFSSVVKDITKEKKLQAEIGRLDRLHLVSDMAAAIGHEITNPMTSVRSFLQLFVEKQEFANYKSIFEVMIGELDQANAIINGYLSVAKDKKSNRIRQQLNSIIKTIYPLIQAEALENDKYIFLELADLPHLPLDEKEIRQLLHNLVRNGMEAMEPGGCVTVKTFMDDTEAVLAVADWGGGIKPELLNKIGTPFFTTKDTGPGLGLAVCYSIAQRHNAHIDIDTSPAGTTVFVRFKVI